MPKRRGTLLIVFLVAVSCPILVPAQPFPNIDADLTLAGNVTWPADPCQRAGDNVALAGHLRLRIQIDAVAAVSDARAPVRIQTILHDVNGVGSDGTRFHAVGTTTQVAAWAPVDPWLIFFSAVYDLVPGNGCCRGTIIVRGVLRLQSDGSLNLAACEEGTACTFIEFESFAD